MSGVQSWAQLRQQARNLESQTENLFHTYSQYSSASSIPPKPSDEERATEAKLVDILQRRETTVGQLTRLLDSEAALSSSSVKSGNVRLLRDKLAAHRRELERLRTTIATARNRANLLHSVRSDIDAHRAAAAAAAAENPDAAAAEYMLDERRRIDSSHNLADSVLSQAYAVNESFALQRETMASINRRITSAAGHVPGLNQLIGRISSKKRRDGILMGVFIAVCFMVFWWML
jgi:Golgi SNAP receptor complex protein 1